MAVVRHIAVLAVVVVVMASLAVANDQAISLSAENQEVDGNLWRGSGNVKIVYQDVTISCDVIEYNRETMALVASGHVILDQGPRRFASAEMHYNLKTKTGLFLDASAEMPPSYHFTGAVIERLDETHYRIEDATFTSCETDDRPPWDFTVKRGLVEDEGYGRFRSASLRVQEVPVFHLPYVLWPVKRERAMGLMIPSIGYSQLRGAYLGNSLFVPIGSSYDTTVYLDLYSEGYIGLGSEWRWAPAEGAFGEITGYTIRDKDTGEWEWKLNGKHRQEDLFGFRFTAEVAELSDIDFFQEFDRTFDQNTRRDLYSYGRLNRGWGPYALTVLFDRRKTFLDSGDIVLHQLPEAELRVRSTRVGLSEAYWTLISSINFFDVDRGGDLAATYGRADLFPTISYTLPGPPWLTVTPKVGGRATVWSAQYSEDRTTFEDEWLSRTYLIAGADVVGPSVSRIFNTAIGPYSKFKHLIEPRIEYEYLSDVDSTRVPVFDEVDSARPSNRATVTLSNRLFGKAGDEVGTTRELLSLDLYQDYSFDEPLGRDSEGNTTQGGPLNAALRLTPVSGFTFDARAGWDTVYDALRTTSLSASVLVGGVTTNLTWYQSQNPQTGDRQSSQVRLMMNLRRPDIPWSGSLNLAYDVHNVDFLQQQYQVHYEGSCWGVTMEYRDLKIGLFPSRDYRLLVSLKDVGKLPELKGSLDSSLSN